MKLGQDNFVFIKRSGRIGWQKLTALSDECLGTDSDLKNYCNCAPTLPFCQNNCLSILLRVKFVFFSVLGTLYNATWLH